MKRARSVPDCEKPVMAKGWCSGHYYRLRPAPACGAAGCKKPSTTKGFCSQHYARFRRHGDPLAGRIERGETQRWIASHIGFSGEDCLIWPFARASHGYGVTTVSGQYALAHRVMCEAAHGSPPSARHEAAHSCGQGHEGCVNPRHLRWATVSENARDRCVHGTQRGMPPGEGHKMAKLTEGDVLAIRKSYAFGATKSELAREFGVSRSNIFRIVNRQLWAHVA